MDQPINSASIPDGDSSVFSSPDSLNEAPRTEKFRTSISVSSLAERFERSGDFGSVSENTISEKIENNSVRSRRFSESKDKSCSPGENKVSSLISMASDKNDGTDQITQTSNDASDNLQYSISATESNSTEQKVKNEDISRNNCVGIQASNITTNVSSAVDEVNSRNESFGYCMQTSPESRTNDNGVQSSSPDDSGLVIDDDISKAVKEKIEYYLQNISENFVATTTANDFQSAYPEESGKDKSIEMRSDAKNITAKDLEESFISALSMAKCCEKNPEKTTDILSVPSIQITEASDREDSSSDDAGDVQSKTDISETKIKTVVTEMEMSNSESSFEEPVPSPSTTVTRCEVIDEKEVSQEESRSEFYSLAKEPSMNLDEIQQGPVNVEAIENERMEYIGTHAILEDVSEDESSSCFYSKAVHGVIMLTSFIIAVAGFILYNMAHDGKVPDFCEYLGLVTTVLAGITGAFSCFCYSVLEVFPGLPEKYERMRESQKIHPEQKDKSIETINLNEESWSSDKEREFRLQNGMSSARTSASSGKSNQSNTASSKKNTDEYLLIRHSDHKELVDKTEKLKREVEEIIESFSEVMEKLKEIELATKLESGMENGF